MMVEIVLKRARKICNPISEGSNQETDGNNYEIIVFFHNTKKRLGFQKTKN